MVVVSIVCFGIVISPALVFVSQEPLLTLHKCISCTTRRMNQETLEWTAKHSLYARPGKDSINHYVVTSMALEVTMTSSAGKCTWG
jgi:hypothetical protein